VVHFEVTADSKGEAEEEEDCCQESGHGLLMPAMFVGVKLSWVNHGFQDSQTLSVYGIYETLITDHDEIAPMNAKLGKFSCWMCIIVPLTIIGIGMMAALRQTEQSELPELKSDPYRTCVQRVFPGWLDENGKVIERNSLFGSRIITVVIRNLDRWLIDRAYANPKLLDGKLTLEELVYYDVANQTPEKRDFESKTERYRDIRRRYSAWHREQRSQLRLTVAGQMFETIKPCDQTNRPRAVGEDTWEQLLFRVEPGSAQQDKWSELARIYGIQCDAPITVSLPDGQDMPTEVNSRGVSPQHYRFALLPPFKKSIAWAGMSLVTLFLLAVGLNTRALRAPKESGLPDGAEPPWSLSRLTLAWWLMICSGAFLFLWTMTGNYNNISGSAPILLGINGGTLMFATLIAGGLPKKNNPTVSPIISAGFFQDLISEGTEPEIARIQMIAWNLLLGVVFAWQTLNDWKMPEFDATLMTLLGISSSAYVGFKYAARQ